MATTVIQEIARSFQAWLNTGGFHRPQQSADNVSRIHNLIRDHLPHGSGFDNGVVFDYEHSRVNRLVFVTAYHHMSDSGYTHWTEHRVIVTPDLAFGFELKVGGRDSNNIKDHIAEVFHHAFSAVLLTPKENAKKVLGLHVLTPDPMAADEAHTRGLIHLEELLRQQPWEVSP